MKHIENNQKPPISNEKIIKRFKVPCQKHTKWWDDLTSATPIERKKMLRFVRIYPMEQEIFRLIKMFTKNDTTNEDFVDQARKTKGFSRGKVKKISRIENGIKIETKKGNVVAYKLLEKEPALSSYMPWLSTDKREHRCHHDSLTLSILLTRSNIEHDVVSGFVYTLAKNETYFHTWIEPKIKDSADAVIDTTLGALINKDGYYMINHIAKVNRISSQDIYHESEIFNKLATIVDGAWASDLYFYDRELALKLYEYYFGSFKRKSVDGLLEKRRKNKEEQPEPQ